VGVPETVLLYREHPEALSADRERMWRLTLDVYAHHEAGSAIRSVYRNRIARTLLWLTIYLVQHQQQSVARGYLSRYGSRLGIIRRAALGWLVRSPLLVRASLGLRSAAALLAHRSGSFSASRHGGKVSVS
jgi:hypothetical protein